ncbi:glycerol channel [Entomophthora muscae]|uniref:Glycerol channel n=1 Tax=Entomophthora muscae TaxID=34485 RepID=A0ACC2RQD2_9FUNG|nr:glycerol channel [Entomophthora muscae]
MSDKSIYDNDSRRDYYLPPREAPAPSFRYAVREYAAELIGTLVLVLVGSGTTAQVTFNEKAVGSSYLSINMGWAMGLSLGIMIAGPISGAHLNPAVTLTSAMFNKFKWKKVPGFIIAQVFGAFLGAALVYAIYWPALQAFDSGIRETVGDKATANIFATYPFPGTPIYSAFFTEVIDTALLLIGVCAITNPKHQIPTWGVALSAGLLLNAIGMSVGLMTGYAMNPARDFGPRVFTAISGWGTAPFTASGNYFWVPMIAPFIGALVGMSIHDFLIDPQPSYF